MALCLSKKCQVVFRANFLVEASVSTEHVHEYESAGQYHHATQVFTLKQKPTLLSGERDGGERKCRREGVQHERRKKTGRMGARVRGMEVRGVTDVTISIRPLMKIMAFRCVLSNVAV